MLFVPVKLRDHLHLCFGQRKIENRNVLADMRRIARARNDDHTVLQVPPQDHLRRGLAVRCCNPANHRITEQCAGLAAPAQWVPGLHCNAKPLYMPHHRTVLIIGVDLILDQRRLHRDLRQESIGFPDIIA